MQTRTDSSSAYDDPALFQAALDRFQQDAETAVNQAHAGRLAHIQAIRDPIERTRALLDYHENPGKDPTRPHPTKPDQRVRKNARRDGDGNPRIGAPGTGERPDKRPPAATPRLVGAGAVRTMTIRRR